MSFLSEGKIDFSRIEGVQWVYSKEHFTEIRRSSVPNRYLCALDDLGARLLDIDLRNWKYSGSATLIGNTSAEEAYEQYLTSINEVPFDTRGLQVLMAWLNGGADSDAVLRVPDELEEQIWQMIALNVPESTCDQFFGFEPIGALNQSPWSAYEGIIRCCAILDIVGFQAENKARNPEKIENVMSDAAHIAAAAYCTAVISADRRFARRAKAIYEYKGVGTTSLITSVAG